MQGFSKDILLIDFETTGLDIDKDLPIQLGAVLLDKQSLEEKKSYLSNINQPIIKMDDIASRVHGIKIEDLKSAPSPKQVIVDFLDEFGTEVYLASWNEMLDHSMLHKLLKGIGKTIYEHDYHYIDVWSLTYFYLVKNGHGDIIRSEPTFKYFNLPSRKEHNALQDCRLAAEVLRKVYFT